MIVESLALAAGQRVCRHRSEHGLHTLAAEEVEVVAEEHRMLDRFGMYGYWVAEEQLGVVLAFLLVLLQKVNVEARCVKEKGSRKRRLVVTMD